MTPPADLPPPPPAIHAPAPNVTQSTSVPANAFSQSVSQVIHRLPHLHSLPKMDTGRWWHIKHHRGRKHKSQATRSNKRKAARKAKHRR